MKYYLKDYLGDVESTLRYLPIAEALERKSGSILEVGSGDFGLTRFLKRRITGADIQPAFTDQISPLIDKVIVKGVILPFADNSFDYVISVDMLEHVGSDKRKKSIDEMIRVAKKGIFIAVPAGLLSESQDEFLNEFYQKTHGKEYLFLKEHLDYKLPSVDSLKTMLKDSAAKAHKKITISTSPNLNLQIRKLMMLAWIRPGLTWRVVFKSFGLLIPIRSALNFGDCYRVIIKVKISK